MFAHTCCRLILLTVDHLCQCPKRRISCLTPRYDTVKVSSHLERCVRQLAQREIILVEVIHSFLHLRDELARSSRRNIVNAKAQSMHFTISLSTNTLLTTMLEPDVQS